MDWAALVIAVLAAVLSFGSAIYTTRLASRLEEERRVKTKAEQLDELMARYRDPLLRAAFDLQSRLYNIARGDFLAAYYRDETPDTKAYAVENTLYVVGEYLGWVEILRQEVFFLELGDELENRDWNTRLDAVRRAFLTDRYPGAVLRLFNGQQRAIGELMTVPIAAGEGRLTCMGFARFVEQLDERSFSRWFDSLRGDVDTLAGLSARPPERLVALHNALVDVIDLLDPENIRFPVDLRTRLDR
jgi:hypothetical protein